MIQNCDLFVVGTVSLDTLHFAGRMVHTVGGAGLYTALAARRAGVRAGLFAPKPEPLPDRLRPIADRLLWIGLDISPQALPRLEIEHHGQGRATLLDAAWGAEPRLTPDVMPSEMAQVPLIHIAALSTARRQLDFLQAIRQWPPSPGEPPPRISVGTYARLVYGDTEQVRRLFALADIFFMNENEARGLFGSLDHLSTQPDRLLFVTRGEAGVLVVAGQQVTPVPGQPATELDPTGAGDTFCGATLAGLIRHLSPVAAAQAGVVLAARTVKAAGPAALLGDEITNF
jgi:ribokinase